MNNYANFQIKVAGYLSDNDASEYELFFNQTEKLLKWKHPDGTVQIVSNKNWKDLNREEE